MVPNYQRGVTSENLHVTRQDLERLYQRSRTTIPKSGTTIPKERKEQEDRWQETCKFEMAAGVKRARVANVQAM